MKFLHSKNRLEALSDGVFAFAATLMVVNIGVTTNIVSFKEELPNLLSFAVSFFVMMAIWKTHYNFFRRTNYIDNWIITLNMILLFTVLFYVFPVKSLINTATGGKKITGEELSSIFQMYSIGFSLIFLSIHLMYLRAFKKDRIEKKNYELLFYARHFFIFVIVGFSSFILAKLKVGLQFGAPGFVYAILGFLCWWHAVSFWKKHPKD